MASTRSSGSGFRANARSNRPRPRPLMMAWISSTSLRTTSISGWVSRNDLSAAGISSAAAVWDTPTRMRARSPLRAESTSAPMASTSPRARRALL